jgi:hypothetical protein
VSTLPLYDADAPITCTIRPDETADRAALLERLRASLERLDRTEHGLLLHFPADPGIEADVRRFAADEKRCCQFWGFAVEADEVATTLRWDAPPDASELIARIASHLEGDEPLDTAITGVL